MESPFFYSAGDKLEKLSTDPFASISQLSNLRVLHIRGVYDGESMIFQRGWLPKLHTLTMGDFLNMKSISMMQHTMRNLQWLALFNFRGLKEVPHGIEFCESLQNLMLVGMRNEFMDRIQRKDKERVQHISTVRYFDMSRRMEVRLFQDS